MTGKTLLVITIHKVHSPTGGEGLLQCLLISASEKCLAHSCPHLFQEISLTCPSG